jgi:hypothetical protein
MSGEKSDSVSMDVKDIREYLFIFYIFPSSKSVHDLSLKLEEMKKIMHNLFPGSDSNPREKIYSLEIDKVIKVLFALSVC